MKKKHTALISTIMCNGHNSTIKMYKTCHLELLNDELNIVKYFAFERLSNATCYKNLTMPTSVCCTLNCIH